MPSTTTERADVIATVPPALAGQDAVQLLMDHYGIAASVTALVSERDQNFLVKSLDGARYILKIANIAEDREFTDFQVAALSHIQNWCVANPNRILKVPSVIRSQAGAQLFDYDIDGNPHRVRLVSFVAGEPMHGKTRSIDLCRNLGRYSATLAEALCGFQHAGENPALLWDMKRTAELTRYVHHIGNKRTRDLVEQVLEEYLARVAPEVVNLRSQVIHNDLNPENVMVESNNHDRIAGVIDFGDMLRSPLIFDVGVAASYLRQLSGNALEYVAPFIASYNAVTELLEVELAMLIYLVKTRLAASLTILHWRVSLRAEDDAYLKASLASESSAEAFLRNLHALCSDQAVDELRRACTARSGNLTQPLL